MDYRNKSNEKSPLGEMSIMTPIGNLRIISSEVGLRSIDFLSSPTPESMDLMSNVQSVSIGRILDSARDELLEYFSRDRKSFSVPLDPIGTDFQKRVWRALSEISYGKTISYLTQARNVGNPLAARAVGAANGKNPLPIIVPCHRVIASDGSLHGYSGGLHIKKHLLAIEGVNLSNNCHSTILSSQ